MSRLACLLLCLVAASASANPLIAFERGDSVWVANVDGSGAKKIAKGSAPDISPDGSRIAFHTDTSTKKDVVRQIAVADVASKHVTVFKGQIPSANCQRAIWSPDGKRILFNIWSDADWHLALVNADGSGFRYLKKATPKGNSLWSACWAPDGRSVYAQNLNTICELDLDGGEKRQWSIDSLFPKGGLSSGTYFSISPDGKKLVLDVEMAEEEASLPDFDGPPPAIWIFDIPAGKATRLTKKEINAWHPVWLSDNEILVCTQKRGEKASSVYKMTLPQEQLTRVLSNANDPVISR